MPRRTVLRIIIVLILAVLAFPTFSGLDDGGTEIYAAALWSVTRQHTLWQEDGVHGHLTGTIVRILFFEIYNDVIFVPSEIPS